MTHSQRPTANADEAAEILGVSKSTITRLIQRGDLVAYKLTPRKNSPLRIYRDSIDTLLKTRQVQPAN